LDAQRSVIVLASSRAFYFVPASGGNSGSVVTVYSHPFLAEDPLPNEFETETGAHRAGWTLDTSTSFASRPVFRDRRLAVLQVVEKNEQGATGLYWIGIDHSSPALAFDVVQLGGAAKYAGCARYTVQATVLSVERVERAFKAALRVQPATVLSETDDPLTWKSDSDEQDVSNCVRGGRIWWQNRKFHSDVDSSDCSSPEKPRYVKIHNDGTVVLTDTFQP